MRELKAFNFKRWIDEHRHLLKPPVGNKQVFTDSEFIIMVVGGRTAARISTSIRARNSSTSSKAASRWPRCRTASAWTSRSAKARSSCCRRTCRTRRAGPPNTVGLVIERTRRAGERDGFQWYCENCGNKLYEEFVEITNIETQLPPVFDRFFGDPAHRDLPRLRHRDGQPPTPMIAELTFGGQKVRAALDRGVSLAIAGGVRRAGPAAFRRGAPSRDAVRGRQFLRQRRHRRLGELLDDHAHAALPDDAHRERRAPHARGRRRLARRAARPAARRGS